MYRTIVKYLQSQIIFENVNMTLHSFIPAAVLWFCCANILKSATIWHKIEGSGSEVNKILWTNNESLANSHLAMVSAFILDAKV